MVIMSRQSKFLRQIKPKSSIKRPPLGHEARSSIKSRQLRSTVLLNRKKQPQVIQHPEMVAPDYDSSEPERSITPIVQELTKIKERVTEVSV